MCALSVRVDTLANQSTRTTVLLVAVVCCYMGLLLQRCMASSHVPGRARVPEIGDEDIPCLLEFMRNLIWVLLKVLNPILMSCSV